MAVRFHLPSKVYEHQNAFDGVERGNIVGWRQDVAAGAGRPAASTSARSSTAAASCVSTVGLFATAIVLAALSVLARRGCYLAFRAGPARRPRRAG